MKRGVSIAALTACGVAGLAVAVMLAAAPRAGADEGTTSTSITATDTTSSTTTITTTTPQPPQPKVIVAGVKIGGTLIGGLTAAEARTLVTTRFFRPIRLVGGPGSRITVTPRELGAVPDIESAVGLAARVKRPGFAVPLNVAVSTPKVDRLVSTLAKRFQREPVDATLRLHNLKPIATRDVPGRRLKPVVATRAIVLALKTQKRGLLELPFEKIEAPVKSDILGHAIVIRRSSNELYFYRVGTKPKLVRMFKVATGRSEYPTPLGKFEVVNKQENPWWYPPAGSDWAKDAEPVPPGAGNPLGTRWMGISSPYVGIHGTPNAASIGYSASHGCIRMLIPQVEWLFTQVELGTPVFIVAA
ncbi:MAG: L,D-transpeptidase/peptidoglycan binding protein [Thermoleophilia bacterium]|nr:L,D-transpeptidase/peptidoglycan binding protein [Thermoleophilia bacterium]